jgi:hypothetical protein
MAREEGKGTHLVVTVEEGREVIKRDEDGGS